MNAAIYHVERQPFTQGQSDLQTRADSVVFTKSKTTQTGKLDRVVEGARPRIGYREFESHSLHCFSFGEGEGVRGKGFKYGKRLVMVSF